MCNYRAFFSLEIVICVGVRVRVGIDKNFIFQTVEEREWFAMRYEQLMHESLSNEEKSSLAKLMLKCQVSTEKALFAKHDSCSDPKLNPCRASWRPVDLAGV